jgi:hypothetical protein
MLASPHRYRIGLLLARVRPVAAFVAALAIGILGSGGGDWPRLR